MGLLGGIGKSSVDALLRKPESRAIARAAVPAADAALNMAPTALTISSAARSMLDARSSEIAGLTFKPAAQQLALGGGHHSVVVMEDQTAQKWVFKVFPENKKARALGEVAGSQIFETIGLKTPRVHSTSQMVDGQMRPGDIQKLVDHSGQSIPQDMTRLSQAQLDDLTQLQVGRWLLGDHDGKTANHLILNDGHIEAIDLGNMYRNFPHDKLDRTYSPNPEAPVYNRMWDAYVSRKVDINFDKGLETVSKIEAMPDAQFVSFLRPYAEAAYKTGDVNPSYRTADEFLQAALKRKQNIRDQVTNFYDSLARERGFPGGLSQALEAAPGTLPAAA